MIDKIWNFSVLSQFVWQFQQSLFSIKGVYHNGAWQLVAIDL